MTNSDDPTADYFQNYLEEKGISYCRFNTDLSLIEMTHRMSIDDLTSFDVQIQGTWLDLHSITGVWYRRPIEPRAADSLSWSTASDYVKDEGYYYLQSLWKLLEHKNWVSHPWSISWASKKPYQLRLAREIGLQIPSTIVTTDPQQALEFYHRHSGKIITKPFKGNVVEVDGQVATFYTSRVEVHDLDHLETVRFVPTMFQEEIPKLYEVRVTVFGDTVFAAMTDSQSDPDRTIDWRKLSPLEQDWQTTSIPESVATACVEMVKRLNLSFGTFDFAVTPDNNYIFFEINPNGQWAWLERMLGMPMRQSLANVLLK